MEIEIIKAIQSISSKFLDILFFIITKFGEEIFFLGVFAFLYWCVSKSSAIKLGLIYCFSAIVNSIIKTIVKRPRPYVADDTIRNVYQANGYSFPSGHSQSYSVIATELGYTVYRQSSKRSTKIWYTVVAIILGLLVGLSRMYLGQHYLTDVLTGLVLGFVIVVLVEWILSKFPKIWSKINLMYVLYFGIAVCVIAFIIMLAIQSSHTSIYKYLCLFLGVAIGHILNEKFIHYDPKTTVAKKSIIAIIGYIVCAIMYVLLGLIPNKVISTSLIHFVVSIMITAVIPLIAKAIEKKEKSKCQKDQTIVQ